MTFQIGDIVRLKTGSCAITVTRIHKNQRLSGEYSSGYTQTCRPFKDFVKLNEEQPMTSNNNSALVSLLQGQRGMTTVKVRLSGTRDTYTYKKLPGLQLEPKDRVVVQCNKSLAIGEVVEVDEFADIDLESGIHYKWIVQKIDTAHVRALEEEETKISKQLAAAEAQSKLENLARFSGIDLSKIQTPLLTSPE